MSAERTKTLWISAAVAAFALVVALAGVFLFAPTRSGPEAPASLGNLAAPKAADPQDYLMAPPPLPASPEPPREDGDIIVIYGEKPEQLTPLPSAAPAQASPPAAVPAPPQPSLPSPAVPAPASPVKATPKPAAKPAPAAKAPVNEYWVQTGSFSRRDLAEDQKRELGARGIAALVTVRESGETIYYRVRVGPYSTEREAQGWLGKIKVLPGCAEAYVSLTKAQSKP